MTDFDADPVADPDGPLARAAAELGEPEAVFAVSTGRVRAKMAVAGGLLLFGGVANYLWWVVGPGHIHHIIFVLLISPLILAASMFRHIAKARGLNVLVYPTGLLRVHGDAVESYPWAEVIEVRLRTHKGEPRFELNDAGEIAAAWIAVELPTLKFWEAELTVVRDDGTETVFTPALAGYAELVERVQRETFAARWLAMRITVRGGQAVNFGKFIATPGGLVFGTLILPWAELAEVTMKDSLLTVKRVGKWLPWATVAVAEVSNPHLFLALVVEMKR